MMAQWNIESIATFVKDTAGGFEVLTQDFDVYRWVDGDGDSSHRRFDLTRVHIHSFLSKPHSRSILNLVATSLNLTLAWTSH